jgi:hypothetical protein
MTEFGIGKRSGVDSLSVKAILLIFLENVRTICPYFVLWHEVFWEEKTRSRKVALCLGTPACDSN